MMINISHQTEEEIINEWRNSHYLPLQIATIRGDWESFSRFIEEEPEAIRVGITDKLETALVMAVRSSQRNHFVKKLIEKMTPEDVAIPDISGRTALNRAAYAGNIEAAKMLVNKNPNLPNVARRHGRLPVHDAAYSGNREMTRYLLYVTREDVVNGPKGCDLLYQITNACFYDMALILLRRNPKLAWEEPSPLRAMTYKSSSFPSGTSLRFMQKIIYSGVPIKLEANAYGASKTDIENAGHNSLSCVAQVKQRLSSALWDLSGKFGKTADVMDSKLFRAAKLTLFPPNLFINVLTTVPQIKQMRELKLLHHQATELLRCLCAEVVKSNFSTAQKIFSEALTQATKAGIHEIVEEILASYPRAIYFKLQNEQFVFQFAIVCRRQNVFNLIYQLKDYSYRFLSSLDGRRDTGLHLAGRLTPYQELRLRETAAGAAFQLQRECQWFKEVEKLALTRDKEQRNIDDLTPYEVFTESHKELVKEGEKWMKDTANSCSIVAALVVTIMFAAAITVPGGNKESGYPNFFFDKAFTIFGIFDALALFSSATSVLMFLSIFTSRYGEEDFLYNLPMRLIIGLATLFISILSMMIAFGCTLYLVLRYKQAWAFIPVIALASVPVTSFAGLQFPLLVEMIKSTYGPGIFRKIGDRVLV